MTLTSGADSAYLYDLLLAHGREHEYRQHEGSATAAKLIGAAVAMVAGGFLGRHAPAVTYSASACVCSAAALVAFMMREPAFTRQDDSAFVQGMAHAARAVVTQRPLRFAVFFSVLLFALLRMGLYLYPPYLNRVGLDTAWVGVVLALLSLVGAGAAAGIERVRRWLGEARLAWAMPLMLAASFVVLARWYTAWGLALIAVQSLVNGIYSPFSKELLNREIADSGQRATVLSVESVARRLGFGGFGLLVGVLIDAYGMPAGLYLCAAAGLIGGAALLASSVRRHRRGLAGFEGEVTPTPLPALSVPSPALAADPGLSMTADRRA
jgi:predicted MFS family arabinose efflux permease